jgi:hypothetical protein
MTTTYDPADEGIREAWQHWLNVERPTDEDNDPIQRAIRNVWEWWLNSERLISTQYAIEGAVRDAARGRLDDNAEGVVRGAVKEAVKEWLDENGMPGSA